jgi:transcriptional regulator with GAF, ATPase, and Fis domain
VKNSPRYQRIKKLVKSLNKQRRKQAKQIDILCNDIIQAHRGFIHNLDRLAFTAQFTESIIGIIDLDHLLYTAATIIKQHFYQMNLTFCINNGNDFNLYAFESDECQLNDEQRIEQYFNKEAVTNIINNNKICLMDDLLEMGLIIKPTVARQISVTSIPLSNDTVFSGFIFLYNTSSEKIDENHLEMLTSIKRSLSLAIKACPRRQHLNN